MNSDFLKAETEKLLKTSACLDRLSNTEVSFDDFNSVLNQACSKYAPCGKVAFVFSEQAFLEKGVFLTEFCDKNGFKSINFVMEESNNLEDILKLCSLPEDVRIVVSLTSSLFTAVSYFASLRDIPFLVVQDNVFDNVFLNSVKIIKGGMEENFLITAKRIITFDFKEKNAYKMFSYVESRIIDIIDYKIYSEMKGGFIDKFSLNLLIKSIEECFGILSFSFKERISALIFNVFRCHVADSLTDNLVFKNSSVYTLSNFKKIDLEKRLFFCYRLIKLYRFYLFSDDIFIVKPLRYNERADFLCQNLDIKELEILTSLNEQIDIYRKNSYKLKQIKETFKKAVDRIYKKFDRVILIYLSLGGEYQELNKEEKSVIKNSGDLPHTFNLATLMREERLLDVI